MMKTQRLTVPIEDLSRGSGNLLQVERALVRLPDVVHAYVNPATEMAYVEYDPEQVDNERMLKAVKQAGFRAGVSSLR
jgi:cation transport ATPase